MQIVHDLKNQLNGLKLYATFLRKRMEKTERAEDEIDTIRKLIAGLDRSAEDLSMISEYGHPIHLHRQPKIDLQVLITGVATSLNAQLNSSPRTTGALAGPIVIVSEARQLAGDFDSAALGNALRSISTGALKMMNSKAREGELNIRLREEPNEGGRDGLIEWKLMDRVDHDVFHSFAGSESIRMSLAAKIIEAHGGTAESKDDTLRVRLPLAKS